MTPRTLLRQAWDSHTVHAEDDGTTLLYIDRHLVHEVTSAQAFEGMKLAGRPVWRVSAQPRGRRPQRPHDRTRERHSRPLYRGLQVETLDKNCAEHGIVEFKMSDIRQGIARADRPGAGRDAPE